MALAIQSLVVMDWFLAATTGQDARGDALLRQHLTDFVPVIPLIPNHPGRRRQSLSSTSAAVKSLLAPAQVEPQGTTFAVAEPVELAGQPPWCATNQAGGTPPLLRLDAVRWALMSVASIISTSGSGASGGSGASDADNSEKISSKTPLSHQRRQRL